MKGGLSVCCSRLRCNIEEKKWTPSCHFLILKNRNGTNQESTKPKYWFCSGFEGCQRASRVIQAMWNHLSPQRSSSLQMPHSMGSQPKCKEFPEWNPKNSQSQRNSCLLSEGLSWNPRNSRSQRTCSFCPALSPAENPSGHIQPQWMSPLPKTALGMGPRLYLPPIRLMNIS